jgi:drug/metabolite transporter (DMT)-like permease
LLGVAILAIASSAVLVRWADAPAIALAFWRTLGGAVLLGPAARRSRRMRAPQLDGERPPSTAAAIVVAGLALAVHFSTWLASLEMTSVAASVTIVSSAPIFVALIGTAAGTLRLRPKNWAIIGVALGGVAIITGGDLGSGGDHLRGDLLALIGAIAMAVYLVFGDRARATLDTSTYAARAYGVAAIGLVPAAVVTETPLWGFDRRTWLVIGAMVLGPQLCGHTVLNLLLRRLGSLTVALALLAEPFGASVLTWLIFAEVPPAGAWIGGPIVVAALALHLVTTTGRDQSRSRLAANSA